MACQNEERSGLYDVLWLWCNVEAVTGFKRNPCNKPCNVEDVKCQRYVCVHEWLCAKIAHCVAFEISKVFGFNLTFHNLESVIWYNNIIICCSSNF